MGERGDGVARWKGARAATDDGTLKVVGPEARKQSASFYGMPYSRCWLDGRRMRRNRSIHTLNKVPPSAVRDK